MLPTGLMVPGTPAERRADDMVHVLGIGAGLVGICWLLARLAPSAGARQIVPLAVYGFGLLGMLVASALFNMTPAGPRRAAFKRLDHAMIFVMIAGSYTPFAIIALPPRSGVPLCILVWTMAAIGVGLEIVRSRRREAVALVLYLIMGWVILAFYNAFRASLSAPIVTLLVAGGVVYTVGALVEAHGRIRYCKAVWHLAVVVAAGLHLVAIALVSAG